MISRLDYNFILKSASPKFAEFEISLSGSDDITFSFYYRKQNSKEWLSDAFLECGESMIRKNVVIGAKNNSGKYLVRWVYPRNNIGFNDDVDIEIRPDSTLKIIGFSGSNSLSASINSFGLDNIDVLSGKRYYDDVVDDNGYLYYSGNLIGHFSKIESVFKYVISGVYRFLVCDSGSASIVDVNEFAETKRLYSGIDAISAEYSYKTGNILAVDKTNKNVVEIRWNQLSSDIIPSDFGSVIWSYNSVFPSSPLSSPQTASYGFGNGVTIVDSSPICVDRDLMEIKSYSYFSFNSDVWSDPQNRYTSSNISSFVELSENNFLVIEKESNLLGYSNDRALHKTYNRSLASSSHYPEPSSFRGSLFYPIKPYADSSANLTLSVLNSSELNGSLESNYVLSGRENTGLTNVDASVSRGDVFKDKSQWGIEECFNGVSGTQPLVALTGQRISMNIPGSGVKVGCFSDMGIIKTVYVRESVKIDFVDCYGANSKTYNLGIVSDDENIVFDIPEANQLSFDLSQDKGVHYLFMIKVSITETYFQNNTLETEIFNPRTYNYCFPLNVLWWRQILKEVDSEFSPVSNRDFILSDYSESIESFFDKNTVYPLYYRKVGNSFIQIPDSQKRKIIYDNCFGLSSYFVGFLPGDSGISSSFGFYPEKYVSNFEDTSQILFSIPQENVTINSGLPGMEAEYVKTNIFENYIGTSIFNQKLKDVISVYSSSGSEINPDFCSDGFCILPIFDEIISSSLVCPTGNKRISTSFDYSPLSIEWIRIRGDFYNSDEVNVGSRNVSVEFETLNTPSLVVFGLSIDGGPTVVHNDITGDKRKYIFRTDSQLTESSSIRAFVEIADQNNAQKRFYATKRVGKISKSFINNIRVNLDKVGKVVTIKFDLSTIASFVKYGVSLNVVGTTLSDISQSCYGDVGYIFCGRDKQINFNYNDIFKVEDQYKEIILQIGAISTITNDTIAPVRLTLNLRSLLQENGITEEVVVVLAKKKTNILPNAIKTKSKIYDLENGYSGLAVAGGRAPYLFPSSSSSSGESISSSSLSSSSISETHWVSSSSCSLSSSSSSSSYDWSQYGYELEKSGMPLVNSSFYIYGYHNGRPTYRQWANNYWIKYIKAGVSVNWGIVNNANQILYVHPSTSYFPPKYGWITGPFGVNPPPLVVDAPIGQSSSSSAH